MARFEKLVSFASAFVLLFVGAYFWGFITYKSNLPPRALIDRAWVAVEEVVSPSDKLIEAEPVTIRQPIELYAPDRMQKGLLLMAMDAGDRNTLVRVQDRQGRVIHQWLVRWFDVWSEGEGSWPDSRRTNKGSFLHGMELLPDASLVTNFDYLSTVRLDVCGKTMWKLDNMGHHSVNLAPDGTLWVSALKTYEKGPTGYALHKSPLDSYLLQQLSLDGNILRNIPVIEVLQKNDLHGLLYMSSLENYTIAVRRDTMHLNDIEAFPADLPSSLFSPGDLLVSLRNINTIMVIDPKTLKIKWRATGEMLRQHDPDFMAGDRISVLDNRNFDSDPEAGPPASRVLEFDAVAGTHRVVVSGDGAVPFYTRTKGVHQRLDNGNILVVATHQGRVVEFAPDGSPVWRYEYRVAPDTNRIIYYAAVLPEAMDEQFFRTRASACPAGAPD